VPARERKRKRNKRASRLKSLRSIDMMADAPSEKAYIGELLFLLLFLLYWLHSLYIYIEGEILITWQRNKRLAFFWEMIFISE
jgi:hypothetical protein